MDSKIETQKTTQGHLMWSYMSRALVEFKVYFSLTLHIEQLCVHSNTNLCCQFI